MSDEIFRNEIKKCNSNQQGKTCAFSGHRPQSLPFGYCESDIHCLLLKQELEKTIIKLNSNNDVTHFITGMALGVDMYAAEIVLNLKSQYPIFWIVLLKHRFLVTVCCNSKVPIPICFTPFCCLCFTGNRTFKGNAEEKPIYGWPCRRYSCCLEW